MMNAEDLAEESAAIAEEFRFRGNPAEMKQRKENEPWFQIIKSVIELQTFTISEINELTRILANKKRTCEREREELKMSQGSMQNSSGPCRKKRFPPLPEHVLQKIFSSLPKLNIFSNRLVCRDWSSAGAMELRNRIHKSLDFYGPSKMNPNSQMPKDDVNEFLKIISTSRVLPVNSFHLKMKWLRWSSHFCLIENFFKLFGPILKYLSLDFSNYLQYRSKRLRPSSLLRTQLDGVSLEKLQILRLEFHDFKNGDDLHNLNEDTRTSFMTDYFASAPNLQKLIFKSDHSLGELVMSFENSELRYLNTLFLESSTLYDKELIDLGHSVNLKHVSFKINQIGFKSETMKGFLQSQSKLEYLKLFSYERNSEFQYEFPRMESLKMFSISSDFNNLTLRFARIDWNLSFPNLEEFKICKRTEWQWRASLFPADLQTVHHGVKIINFPPFTVSLTESLPVMSRMFPNVQIVKMCLDDLFRPILYNWFPNINKIVVRHFEDFYTVEMCEEDVKTSLKSIAWGISLGPGKKMFCEDLLKCVDNLTEFDYDLNYTERLRMGPEMVRRIYDGAWFLRLIRERIKLQQLNEKLLEVEELKKRYADFTLDCDTYDDGDGDDTPSNTTIFNDDIQLFVDALDDGFIEESGSLQDNNTCLDLNEQK